MVFIFIILTFFCISIILYFSFSKTVITIVPNPQRVQSVFTFQVKDTTEIQEGELSGKLLTKEIENEKRYPDVGTKQIVESFATGTVTIINNSSKPQGLVASTRLLSEEGVLFRTQETVNVQAGQRIKVRVKADEAGARGNILPSKFTIVALWAGLQEQIFGESDAPVEGGTKETVEVSPAEMQSTKSDCSRVLSQDSMHQLINENKSNLGPLSIDEALSKKEIISITADVVGDESTSEIVCAAKIKIIAIALDEEKKWLMVESKLKKQISATNQLFDVNKEKTAFEILDIQETKGLATIQVRAEGNVIIRLSSPLLDRSNFINKDKQDITSYLLNYDEIKDVKIHFSPFWTFRAPALEDHIEIKLIK